MIPGLSEANIRKQAGEGSFERGRDYYGNGAVLSLTRRGQVIHSEVAGSEYEPYRVWINFDKGGLRSGECSCPYDWGGWCKHIVAALLACLHEPETLVERPSLADMLAPLEREQLQELVQRLVRDDPKVLETVDLETTSWRTVSDEEDSGVATKPRPALDPEPFRRQVQHICREAISACEYGDDWEEDHASDRLRELLEQGGKFLAGDAPEKALLIFQTITEAYLPEMDDLRDYGLTEEFTCELDECLAEALLSVEWSETERQQWRQRLLNWDNDTEDGFTVALAALDEGWKAPRVKRLLSGKAKLEDLEDEDDPDSSNDLILIRLRILERQEQFEEYLHLSRAAGHRAFYLCMLVRMGKVDQALQEGLGQSLGLHEAQALAKALREHDAPESALAIALHGLQQTEALDQPGVRNNELAAWTSELAEALGKTPEAIQSGTAAFKHDPSLNGYLRLQELSAEADWPDLKAELLQHLRSTRGSWQADVKNTVDVFLHEDLLDDAIATVSGESYYHRDAIHRVMDTTIARCHRLDWVIENARPRAEEIMDSGKAQLYHHAANWLRRVRSAYKASGGMGQWRKYYAEVSAKHGRKYKLMGLLKPLA